MAMNISMQLRQCWGSEQVVSKWYPLSRFALNVDFLGHVPTSCLTTSSANPPFNAKSYKTSLRLSGFHQKFTTYQLEVPIAISVHSPINDSFLRSQGRPDASPTPKTEFTPERTMTTSGLSNTSKDSSPASRVLSLEEQAIDDGCMAHEISGITEGRLGESQDGYVIVAVSDKNSITDNHGAYERNGTGEVAISYTVKDEGSSGNITKYELVNFTISSNYEGPATVVTGAERAPTGAISRFELNGTTRQMGGFEDVSYNAQTDTYYFVQEGGSKTWDPARQSSGFADPVIVSAKLVSVNGVHEMQVIGFDVVPSKSLDSAYTPTGSNGVEGMAVDQFGNIYVGFQDSGNIYKGTLGDGSYSWGKEPVLQTGHTDLAGMAFDAKGNLLVSFGNFSDGNGDSSTQNEKIRMYESDGSGNWIKNDAYSININERAHAAGVNTPQLNDAEGIMVDHAGNIIVGSDNAGSVGPQLKNLAQDQLIIATEQAT